MEAGKTQAMLMTMVGKKAMVIVANKAMEEDNVKRFHLFWQNFF
ncbi:hypothetical protein CCACVL1_02044 [Corchorus capsularis]|uniref:Uncharacterized protein n=1 Tax=Corchorus capsularis TaxID=210143 RepID=A0A1R3KDI2_COCAP|nr:hypothetical protein CCACVL1_02044 [Corchorus capsularis]